MKKTSLILSSVATIVLSLTGCGGGSGGGSPTASTKTGTGYYVDSAVAGVNYTCGSQTGTTDKDGKFTFEQGKECTFEVAGVTLKKVPADNLVDNAKIVENNVTVARFLQSIDNDGNSSNGIQITVKTIVALTKTLKQENIKTVPDTTTKLDTVVSSIHQEDGNFKGHVTTKEEALNHLKSTRKTVVKDLLAGKTFYTVDEDENNDNKLQVTKLTFDNSLSYIHAVSPNSTEDWSISIDGNKLIFTNDTDNSYTIIKSMRGYILFEDHNGDGSLDGRGHRLYQNKADAEAYYKSLTNNKNTQSKFTKDMLTGKTFYTVDEDENNDNKLQVTKLTFDNSLSSIHAVSPNSTEDWSISIDGNKLTFSDNTDKSYTIIKPMGKYILFEDHNGDGSLDGRGHRLYKNKADAEAYLNSL